MCVSGLTSVGHVPHGVFEGPDDGVQHQFKLGRGDGEECREAVRVDGLEQVEEMGPVLWIFLKVLAGDQRTSRVSLVHLFHADLHHRVDFFRFITSYLVDHVQGALKDGVKDLGYLAGDMSSQLVDNGRHGAEYFGFTSSRDVALVVDEDSVQQWRNKVFPNLKDMRTNQNRGKKAAEARVV